MALFNAKILKQATDQIEEVPEAHRAILTKWVEMVQNDRILEHKETALDGDFKADIVQGVLGYRGAGDPDGQTVDKEYETGSGPVDLALGQFDGTVKVVAPFELKGAKQTNLDAPIAGRRESPVEQVWRYARHIGRTVRWLLVSNFVEVRLYSYREGEREYESFSIAKLLEVETYARFVTLLSADNLLGGRTGDLLEKSLAADKELSDTFYVEYQSLREDLIAEISTQTHVDGEEFTAEECVSLSQTILDRIMFVAFAEDRELLPPKVLARAAQARNAFSPQPVWENFLGLFKMIDEGGCVETDAGTRPINAYNGGLFRRDPEIVHLNISDATCGKFEDIGTYDFREDVDVEVLGHIFEQSLRDLEKHLAIARGEEEGDFRTIGKKVSRIKKDGVVYTPPFVARFITERTLGRHVEELFATTIGEYAKGDPLDYDTLKFAGKSGSKRWKDKELAAWREYLVRLQTISVVDPACGSGIFLVTAYDVLRREYDRTLDKLAELQGGAVDLFDADTEILTRNLYGVDVNAESLEITKLSLWLKTAKPGKALDDLGETLKIGDSLIEDSNYAYLKHGFTWKSAFPDVFAEGGFDVVLGNPPYVRMELIKAFKPYLQKRYEVVADRADLYAYFYEQGLRLLKEGGRLGYISNNTFFKTGSGKPLRNYLSEKATLETVADFGDVQIFEGVTTYPVIIIAQQNTPGDDHQISYWNVPRVPEDSFGNAFDRAAADFPQSALGATSWELEPPALRKLRAKIIGDYPTLEEVFGAPFYGIKTGLNAAFVIDRATRDGIVANDPNSAELLSPWLEGKDTRRWCVEPRELFIIYIPKNKININEYPGVREHLRTYKEKLEARATEQNWFELQQAQDLYKPKMQANKIIWSDVANESRCALESSGALIANTCYFLPAEDLGLLSFLNSNVAWFVIKALTPEARGGYARFQTQFVKRLPILEEVISNEELKDLSRKVIDLAHTRHKAQEKTRRRIPDLSSSLSHTHKLGKKLQNWWQLDFQEFRSAIKSKYKNDIILSERSDWEDMINNGRREIARLTSEIGKLEAEIDRQIYDIFGLTATEVELLEGSL